MSAIQKAIDAAGSQTALAELLGVTQPTVSEWATGRRPIPDDRCADIERVLDGRVTCEQLRPDLMWVRVRDRTWRWHPRGRPARYVAAAAT